MALNKLRTALREWLQYESPVVQVNHYQYPKPYTHEQIMKAAQESEVREYVRGRRERYQRFSNRDGSN